MYSFVTVRLFPYINEVITENLIYTGEVFHIMTLAIGKIVLKA